jgi:hypothetical protein
MVAFKHAAIQRNLTTATTGAGGRFADALSPRVPGPYFPACEAIATTAGRAERLLQA